MIIELMNNDGKRMNKNGMNSWRQLVVLNNWILVGQDKVEDIGVIHSHLPKEIEILFVLL